MGPHKSDGSHLQGSETIPVVVGHLQEHLLCLEVPTSKAKCHDYHTRIFGWMRNYPDSSPDIRRMESETARITHQCPGDAGSIQSNMLLPVSSQEEVSADQVRQHNCCVLTVEPKAVHLVPAVAFLTKSQTSSFSPLNIFVTSVKFHSNAPSDKLLCPVRTLKLYLVHTKPLRRNSQLGYNSPSRSSIM